VIKVSSTITYKTGETDAYVDDVDADLNNIIREINRGFRPLQVTTAQRDALTNIYNGLVVYNTTTNKINIYTIGGWEEVTSS